MQYRAEIDGLRAIAVLPVILFHAGFSWFSGGYVGVDVFFVISGYLITTILIKELEQGTFSVAKFYERRVRRILPALFFVMMACIPFAWLWMGPEEFNQFSKAFLAISFFSSNILFWRSSGYFDPSAEENPLLHTWSLAVEEQFYIFYPIVLLITFRFGWRPVLYTIIALSLGSLMLSEYGAKNHPMANFYLLPTRAWELGVGAVCAFFIYYGRPRKSSWLSVTGLFLIIFSIVFYNDSTPIPSVYALAPVLGTALIILYGREKTLTARFLSGRLLVGIGLISFSAYLWHQPIFAFARLKMGHEISSETWILLSVFSILLAIISWHYVEKPFRGSKLIATQGGALKYAGLASGLIIAIGSAGYATSGAAFRFNSQQQEILKLGIDYRRLMKSEAYDRYGCFFDRSQSADQLLEKNCVPENIPNRLILFGDSEAAHYYSGLKQSKISDSVFQFTGASCRPFLYKGISPKCEKFYNLFFEEVAPDLGEQDIVIISGNWSNTFKKVGKYAFTIGVQSTVDAITRTGSEVILMGNTPDFSGNPFYRTVKTNQEDDSEVLLRPVSYEDSERVLKVLATKYDIEFISPSSLLCPNLSEEGCYFKRSGEYLFFDGGHLSYKGSRLMSSLILQTVARIQYNKGMP